MREKGRREPVRILVRGTRCLAHTVMRVGSDEWPSTLSGRRNIGQLPSILTATMSDAKINTATQLDVLKIARAFGERYRAGEVTDHEASGGLALVARTGLGASIDALEFQCRLLEMTGLRNARVVPQMNEDFQWEAGGGRKVAEMLRGALEKGTLGEFVDQIRDTPIYNTDLLDAFRGAQEASK
jgi:hypothetical protein